MKFIGIDLFAGAGGVTTGIELARFNKKKIAFVKACINHDPVAIESHAANHKKTIHFTEDIKNFDVNKFPKLKIEDDDITYLWASLECTNFSNAKGGLPRDPDSRTLANHLFRYIEHLSPDYIFIENVREFMSWGDLDCNCKPVSKDKGRLYVKWVNKVKSYGYDFDFRILNSADFGAYTSRKRLFLIFAKTGFPIAWPEPTHTKTPGMFGLKKWNAVKDVLDFSDKGETIFRTKPLSEKTYERIYAGLVKYVANGEKNWFLKYNSAKNNQTVSSGNTITDPSPTITTHVRLGLISPEFLIKYHSNGENLLSVEDCASTLSTKDRLAFVQPEYFIDLQNSQGKRDENICNPCGSLTTVNKRNLITVERCLIDQQYGQSKPIETTQPVGSLTTKPKLSLITIDQYFLLNPQYFNTGSSIENPCFTLIAKMDKKPPYLITTEPGKVAIEVYKNDSQTIVNIKQFMAAHGIIDIKMRMLRIKELLKIQGFKENYILKGTQADQKKFIGNAVVPIVAKKIVEALYMANKSIQLMRKAS